MTEDELPLKELGSVSGDDYSGALGKYPIGLISASIALLLGTMMELAKQLVSQAKDGLQRGPRFGAPFFAILLHVLMCV